MALLGRISILSLLIFLLTVTYIVIPSFHILPQYSGYLLVILTLAIVVAIFALGEYSFEYRQDIEVIGKGLRYAAEDIGQAGRGVIKTSSKLTVVPVKVLEKPVRTGVERTLHFVGRFGLVLIITGIALSLPTPEGLGSQGHRSLALFAFTASLLALEPVPLPIAALMVPVALVAMGIGDINFAFEPFSRPVVFLILGSLFLAEALRKHGIARRLALVTIVRAQGRMDKILLGIMLISGFLSMWVGSTGTVAMLIPVALTISRRIPPQVDARKVLLLLFFGIAVSASVGGMATIIGAPSNAVASGILRDTMELSFIDWMKYGVPAFILILPLSWIIIGRAIKIEMKNIDIEHIREELRGMGKITDSEKEVIGVLSGAGALWMAGSLIEAALGLPPTFMSSAVVAILAVSYLSVRNLINWDDLKGVTWGVFLIIGAGLSLGESLIATGVTEWVAGILKPLVVELPLLLTLFIIVFFSAALTNVLNNTTIAAVFTPILVTISLSLGQSPLILVIPAVLGTTFGYSLPSSSSRMALLSATGVVKTREMLKYGTLLTVPSSLVLVALFYAMIRLGVM